jgi:hypothetical protein
MLPNPASGRRTFAVYILWFLIFFQAISALWGGSTLVLDPTGALFQMPLSALEGTPFRDYLFPGLVLFLLLGVLPALLAYALLARPVWSWANSLNIYRDVHWAWTYALYVGIMLILWIDTQIFLIGYGHFIQTLYALVGVAIVIAALVPSVRSYYRTDIP